MLVQLLNLDWN